MNIEQENKRWEDEIIRRAIVACFQLEPMGGKNDEPDKVDIYMLHRGDCTVEVHNEKVYVVIRTRIALFHTEDQKILPPRIWHVFRVRSNYRLQNEWSESYGDMLKRMIRYPKEIQ